MYDGNQISDEALSEEQNQKTSLTEQLAAKNQRNSANNANVIKNAANVAAKSSNPYAKAIGTAVNAADKISGGRASQSIGKKLNLLNKLTPGGRLAQAALNKMSESGATDKIGSSMSKNNQNTPMNNTNQNNAGNGAAQNNDSSSDSGQEGTVNYKTTIKLLITALMIMTPVLVIIVFCNLFISASQIFINSIDIGTADSLNNDKVEEKINKNKEEWNNEITDDHENLSYNSNIDIYWLENGSEKKYIQVANKVDLSELNDFYGGSIYTSEDTGENIDMNVVYNFYFKLYYMYTYYQKNYGVDLDLSLLMATLNVNTKDKAIVFGSNTIGYDDQQTSLKAENDRFAYDKVHSYVSNPTKGEYDMEVLAQKMISYQATESCVDSRGKVVSTNIVRDEQVGTQVLICEEGQTYRVSGAKYDIDEEKYREFLPRFLENKYFIKGVLNGSSDGEENINNEDSNPNSGEDNSESNNGEDVSTCSLLVRGTKYYKIVNPQTANCYVQGFYDDNSWGLEPKFYNSILALIKDAKSQGCDAAIISGHRTYKKQAYFYNCYVTKKCNSGNLAAKPGYSNHEYGIAADLRYLPDNSTCLNYYHTNAAKYGLEFPLLKASYPEDWHIEPIDIIVGNP